MAPFLYRCPITGQNVQNWVADVGDDERGGYQTTTCLACRLVHLVDPKTGKVFGAEEEE